MAILVVSTALAQAIKQEAPNPEATSGAIQRRVAPPARILKFTIDPDSIKPGESVVLEWSVENPNSTSIEPGIGRVIPLGRRVVSPAVTTKYTLTTVGPNGTVTRDVTVTVAGTKPGAIANAAEAPLKAPVAANGKPDLSGVYGAGGGGRGGAGGGPALKAGAEKFKVVRPPDDTGQYADCMPLAGPQGFAVPYQFQIVQSAHHVAILNGYPGSFRIIPTDGGPHPEDPDPTWMGDSIGHWEGNTLVVDSVGFNDKTELNGYKHTEALHIVERLSRPSYDTLQYDATIEDPNVFARPWATTTAYTLRPDLNKVDEFVCEHNPDYRKYFEKK